METVREWPSRGDVNWRRQWGGADSSRVLPIRNSPRVINKLSLQLYIVSCRANPKLTSFSK